MPTSRSSSGSRRSRARRGELCALRWDDIDLTAGGIELADDAFVFSTTVDGSRPRRPDGMSLAFVRLRRKAKVKDIPLHSLRHFAATRMLDAGVPVRTVAGRLGHANAATTLNVYSHWVETSDQAAAQVLGGLLVPSAPKPKPRKKAGAKRSRAA